MRSTGKVWWSMCRTWSKSSCNKYCICKYVQWKKAFLFSSICGNGYNFIVGQDSAKLFGGFFSDTLVSCTTLGLGCSVDPALLNLVVPMNNFVYTDTSLQRSPITPSVTYVSSPIDSHDTDSLLARAQLLLNRNLITSDPQVDGTVSTYPTEPTSAGVRSFLGIFRSVFK